MLDYVKRLLDQYGPIESESQSYGNVAYLITHQMSIESEINSLSNLFNPDGSFLIELPKDIWNCKFHINRKDDELSHLYYSILFDMKEPRFSEESIYQFISMNEFDFDSDAVKYYYAAYYKKRFKF